MLADSKGVCAYVPRKFNGRADANLNQAMNEGLEFLRWGAGCGWRLQPPLAVRAWWDGGYRASTQMAACGVFVEALGGDGQWAVCVDAGVLLGAWGVHSAFEAELAGFEVVTCALGALLGVGATGSARVVEVWERLLATC